MMSPSCLALIGVLSVSPGMEQSVPPPLVPLVDERLVTAPGSIRWPDELRPLTTLDGPAILAAHAVLQQVLSRFSKESSDACERSARSLDVVVGEQDGVYFVRIDRRVDRCGWAPGVSLEFDGFELYAVSPEGRILARHPALP